MLSKLIRFNRRYSKDYDILSYEKEFRLIKFLGITLFRKESETENLCDETVKSAKKKIGFNISTDEESA